MGANLSLSLFGINGGQFDVPTNSSGTPDSRAARRALVDLLVGLHRTTGAGVFHDAGPVKSLETDVTAVITDEAAISNLIDEAL